MVDHEREWCKVKPMKNSSILKMIISAFVLLLLMNCSDDDIAEYQLTIGISPAESGTVTPFSGMYREGTEIELLANPAEEFVFVNWEGDASGNENPLRIVMLDDKSVTAVFEKVNYSLSLDIIGEGTVSQEIVQAKSTSKDYESGTVVRLTAQPEPEWKFVEWTGDYTGTENPIQLTMDQAKSITAVFEKVTYALTIEIEGSGTVTQEVIQAKSTTDYASGSMVQLTAVPDENWEFVQWSGDHEGNENPLELSITSSMNLTAVFGLLDNTEVFIPDDRFEQALINLGLDDQLDDYVFMTSLKNVEELQLEHMQIQDLTGIEAFENLKILNVSNNELNQLDISQNSLLEQLICKNNLLTSLDISQNLAINTLVATENPLRCVQLHKLTMYWLNWVGGPAAPWFAVDDGVEFSTDCSVSDTETTYIPDDAFEQALINLGIDDVLDDHVKKINIINLISLNVSGNDISDLTGLEDFKALAILDASDNNLSELDLSELGVFYNIDVRNNPLTCVQVTEDQLIGLRGLIMLFTDEGVEVSTDCGN
jgi:hypothetical protein